MNPSDRTRAGHARVSAVLACLAIGFCSAASSPAAGEIRIGLVDMARLFEEYPGVKAAQIRYDAVAREKERLLDKEENEIQKKREDYTRRRPQMGEKERKAAEKDLRARIETLAGKRDAYLAEMKAREEEMSRSLVEEIRAVVGRVAKEKKMDLVMDREKALYVRDAVDLTPDVLERFKAQEGKAQP